MTTTPARPQLRAVTRPLDDGHDPLTAFDGRGFAWLHHHTRIVASGVVARVAPDDVAETLDAVDCDDPLGVPGTGALAVGALPFDPAVEGNLVVPASRRRDRRPGLGH